MEGEDDGSTLQNDLDILSQWEKKVGHGIQPLEVPGCTCVRIQKTGEKRLCTAWPSLGDAQNTSGLISPVPHTWNSHIHRIAITTNQTLGVVRRNIKTKVSKVPETAYNTLVRSQLEYASAVWEPHNKGLISQIEQVQKRAVRLTVNNFDRRESVTKIVQDLGTIDQKRADARLCPFYKIVHSLVAVPLPDYIQYSNSVSRYCHSMAFRQVSTFTDYYKYSSFH